MQFKYIKAIGVEAEGGWWKKPTNSTIHGDGSVNFRGKKDAKLIVGEISSSPMSDWNVITKWFMENWPHRRNKTCGFHIHVSVINNEDYVLLMDKAFYDLFLISAAKFAKDNRMSKYFYHRLEGKNQYCQRKFMAEEQSIQKSKNNCRYAHLNYCYSLRGTIENRLPTAMMTKEKALKTVEWFATFIENYLDEKHKNDKMLLKEVTFEVAPDVQEEENVEIVLD